MADFYQILGVSRDADADTLKRAYRKLARQYHPDVNKEPGAEEKFKEINFFKFLFSTRFFIDIRMVLSC